MNIRDVTRARLRRPAGLRAAGVGVAMTPAITLVAQDLRAHLSDYLQRARQGERITITVHGRPVAVLGPYDPVGTLEDLARVLGEEPGAMAGGEG
jgi:prevent-host-death family protein